MRKVWVSLPAYTGTIHLGTMRALMHDLMALTARGDQWVLDDEAGNAMIGDCRGLQAARFLESECTDMVFVDHDVVWPAGTMLRLLDAPVDFCAVVYPQRKDPINFVVQWAPEHRELRSDAETGLLEVAGVPAGFMRMSRAMLASMVERYADTAFECEVAPNRTAYDLFGAYREPSNPRIKYGEDFSFCRRWRDMGGKIWVFPEIAMGHIGNKHFAGSLGDWLRETNLNERAAA